LYKTAPLITNIATTASRGRSDYQALQASLRQRNVNGIEYLASYTLGRVRTNNRGFYGSTGVAAEGAYWMNTYEPEWNYGPAFFDARHNLVFSANYELPFGRGRKFVTDGGVAGALASNWQVSGTWEYQPGALLDWGAQNIFFYGDIEDIPLDNPTREEWFDTDAGFERDPAKTPAAFQKRAFPFRVDGVRSMPVTFTKR
jgi:hypothetical protein